MENVFTDFKLERKGWNYQTDNPSTSWWSNNGCFDPSYSLTKPVNKDGSLTKYAMVLLEMLNRAKLGKTFRTKEALNDFRMTSVGWQTLRYSGLLYKVDNGIYELSKSGHEYCKKLENYLNRK